MVGNFQIELLSAKLEGLVDDYARPFRGRSGLADNDEPPRESVRLDNDRSFRDLLEALPAAVYTTDADGRITFYNEAAVVLSGRTPKLGTDEWCVTWRLYWPDGTPLPHDQCPMAIALRENRPVRGAEAVAERPDGTRVSFLPFPTPLRDADGKLIGAVNMLVDITEQKQAEERMRLLAMEVDHRANNLLAVAQAAVRFSRGGTVEEVKLVIEGRLKALANAHRLLAESRWSGVSLEQLAIEELSPYFADAAHRNVRIKGPRLVLGSKGAQSVAVVLHELTTNAAKYGALSAADGRVSILWDVTAKGECVLRWREEGGPAVEPVSRKGFGMRVIQRMVRDELDGEIVFAWRPEGLACEITFPLPSLPRIGSAHAPAVGAGLHV